MISIFKINYSPWKKIISHRKCMVVFFSVGTIRVHQQIIRNHSRFQRLTIILFDDDDDMIRLVVQNYERVYEYYSHDVQHENTM